jgi:hypothetical protein
MAMAATTAAAAVTYEATTTRAPAAVTTTRASATATTTAAGATTAAAAKMTAAATATVAQTAAAAATTLATATTAASMMADAGMKENEDAGMESAAPMAATPPDNATPAAGSGQAQRLAEPDENTVGEAAVEMISADEILAILRSGNKEAAATDTDISEKGKASAADNKSLAESGTGLYYDFSFTDTYENLTQNAVLIKGVARSHSAGLERIEYDEKHAVWKMTLNDADISPVLTDLNNFFTEQNPAAETAGAGAGSGEGSGVDSVAGSGVGNGAGGGASGDNNENNQLPVIYITQIFMK